MADVFISYARQDREWVERLADRIAAAGLTVWWDRQLKLGKNFDLTIAAELAAAKIVVVVWSSSAILSDWVKDEAQDGRQRGILIPVTMDGTPPPLGFKQLHSADLSSWTGGETRDLLTLIIELRARAGIADDPAPAEASAEAADRPRPADAAPVVAQPGRGVSRRALIGASGLTAAAAALGYVFWPGAPSPSPQAQPSAPPEGVKPTAVSLRETSLVQTGDQEILHLGLTADGKRAAISVPVAAYLWNLDAGALIEKLDEGSYDGLLALSADGRIVVTEQGGHAEVADGVTGQKFGGVQTGHYQRIDIAPDGARFIAHFDRKPSILCRTGPPEQMAVLAAGDAAASGVRSVFLANGDLAVAVNSAAASEIRIWSADGASLRRTIGLPPGLTDFDLSPDGRRFAVAGSDKSARLFDLETGGPQGAPLMHDGPVTIARFSPDGRRLVTASDDKTARLWNAATGALEVSLRGRHDRGIVRAGFFPGGEIAYTADLAGLWNFWAAADGAFLGQFQSQRLPRLLQISADATRAVLGRKDGGIAVYAIEVARGV